MLPGPPPCIDGLPSANIAVCLCGERSPMALFLAPGARAHCLVTTGFHFAKVPHMRAAPMPRTHPLNVAHTEPGGRAAIIPAVAGERPLFMIQLRLSGLPGEGSSLR